MRSFVAILVGLAGAGAGTACTDDGDTTIGVSFDGTANGQYGGDSFDPRFAVAFTNREGKLEMQFGENPISCERHLHEGTGNPRGLFVRVIVASPAVGEHRGVWIEYDSLGASGTRQSGSSDGVVVIDALDEVMVAGTVTHARTHDELGMLAFNGTFVVTRCPLEG